MDSSIKRISIIGGSGTGKTTLSNNLSKNLNISSTHLDGIHYLDSWKERSKSERDNIILEKIKMEKWIIDGTYMSTLEKRLRCSDLIIYLDYSSFAQVMGVMKRFAKNHGKEKSEIPGCKEKMDKAFFLQVLYWRKNKRDRIINTIKSIDGKKILIFKNRRQLNKWYKQEFKKKMDVKS